MRGQIQKWGNSLALRIPKAFAEETGITENSPVEIRVSDWQIIITRIEIPQYDLDTLLAQVTPKNIHGEIDTGDQRGNEAW